MADKDTKRYLELQMEELKAAFGTEEEPNQKKVKDNREKNAEIAKMYEDAAEYEEDLKGFEEELAIVKANKLEDIASGLRAKFPNEERDYAKELKSVVEFSWTHFVEVEKTHPVDQLELIKKTEFKDLVKTLTTAYPEYDGDFEAEIRAVLIKRWDTLIAIKKEHIKEEISEIKISGLKPNYVKRIYKQYHGIE